MMKLEISLKSGCYFSINRKAEVFPLVLSTVQFAVTPGIPAFQATVRVAAREAHLVEALRPVDPAVFQDSRFASIAVDTVVQ
jgi:hypothetical protein